MATAPAGPPSIRSCLIGSPPRSTTATATGGRNGHTEASDGSVSADLSVPKAMGGPGKPGTTTPEHLFAAGYAAPGPDVAWFEQIRSLAGSLGFALKPKDYKKDPDAYPGDIRDASAVIRVLLTEVDGEDAVLLSDSSGAPGGDRAGR